MPAGFRDLYHVPHELQGLFGEMDTLLWIAVLEHTGQARYRSGDGHIPIAAPDDILRLLPEAALLGATVALVPDSGTSPDPACPLESIGSCRKLPPVDEHTDRRTGLAGFSGQVQPFRRPARPAPLILRVSVEWRRRVFHAGIFLGSGFVFLSLGPAARGIGRIGDHCVKGAGGKALQHLQRIALDDGPGLGSRLIQMRPPIKKAAPRTGGAALVS